VRGGARNLEKII